MRRIDVVPRDEWLPITDDLMFKAVFSRKELLEQLLSAVLPEFGKINLNEVIEERTVHSPGEGKGIRTDIAAEDQYRLFLTEMQNRILEFSPLRARYYQSSFDIHNLHKIRYYKDLKEMILVIFSPDDPFGYGEMVYRFENLCRKNQFLLGDRRSIVYVNCAGKNGIQEYPDLVPFCRYVTEGTINSDFVREVQKIVEEYNGNTEWRRNRMDWIQEKYELLEAGEKKGRKQGLELGLERGLEQGRTEERIKGIRRLFGVLQSTGTDTASAVNMICNAYPETSPEHIRNIIAL